MNARKNYGNGYCSFGMQMPGRQYNNGDYRYGFNGKEKDDEMKGTGNSYDFDARLYDPRVGRWLAVDPFQTKYPYLSPYNFTANNPILFIDKDGKEIFIHGSAEFKLQALSALQSLSNDKISLDADGRVMVMHTNLNPAKNDKPVGTELLSQLAGSKNVFNIKEVTGEGRNVTKTTGVKANSLNGIGTGADIYVNVDPNAPQIMEQTGVTAVPPLQIKIGHELLGHGSQIDKGTVDNSYSDQLDPDVTSTMYGSTLRKSEVKAREIENSLRNEQGRILRAVPKSFDELEGPAITVTGSKKNESNGNKSSGGTQPPPAATRQEAQAEYK